MFVNSILQYHLRFRLPLSTFNREVFSQTILAAHAQTYNQSKSCHLMGIHKIMGMRIYNGYANELL